MYLGTIFIFVIIYDVAANLCVSIGERKSNRPYKPSTCVGILLYIVQYWNMKIMILSPHIEQEDFQI